MHLPSENTHSEPDPIRTSATGSAPSGPVLLAQHHTGSAIKHVCTNTRGSTTSAGPVAVGAGPALGRGGHAAA